MKIKRKLIFTAVLAIIGLAVLFFIPKMNQLAWRVASEIEFKISNIASFFFKDLTSNSIGSQNHLSSHRGIFSDVVVENSEKSIVMASQKGFRYIEIDVSFSKDYIPFIFHDENLKHKTGLDSYTNEVTWEQIRKLRLPDDQKILSLKSFLSENAQLFDGIILDIKGENKYFEKKAQSFHKVIQEANYTKDIFVIGRCCRVLEAIKKLNSKLKIGCEGQGFFYNYINGNDLISLDYYTQFSHFEYCLINKFDMALILWTINKKQDLNKLRSLNNTIILTDLSN